MGILTNKIESLKQNQNSFGYKSLIIILALSGIGLIILSTSRYGIGVVTDSVAYIAAARNILSGNWFVGFLDAPLVDWPPLYPMLLALVGYFTNADPLITANFVNAVIFGITIYLVGILAKRYFSPFPLIALTIAALVLFSYRFFKITVTALSEPLFILFIVLALINANSYLKEKDLKSLILFALVVALSSVTRYFGIVLILFGIVVILLSQGSTSKTKIKHSLLFLIISILPLGLWSVRNYIVSKTFFGYRIPTDYTFGQNLNFTFNTILNWFVPKNIGNSYFLVVILTAVIVFILWKGRRFYIQKAKVIFSKANIFILFTVIYLFFLIIASTIMAHERIGDRLLLPIFIPLFFLVFITASELTDLLKKKFSTKAINVFLIVVISLWFLYQLKIISSTITVLITDGAGGYNTRSWKESTLMKYINNNKPPEGYAIYTNASDALYILTGIKGYWIPSKFRYNSPYKVQQPEVWPEEEESFLIWSYKVKWKNQYTLEELKKFVNIEEIIRFDDGAIYLMNRD